MVLTSAVIFYGSRLTTRRLAQLIKGEYLSSPDPEEYYSNALEDFITAKLRNEDQTDYITANRPKLEDDLDVLITLDDESDIDYESDKVSKESESEPDEVSKEMESDSDSEPDEVSEEIKHLQANFWSELLASDADSNYGKILIQITKEIEILSLDFDLSKLDLPQDTQGWEFGIWPLPHDIGKDEDYIGLYRYLPLDKVYDLSNLSLPEQKLVDGLAPLFRYLEASPQAFIAPGDCRCCT